MVTIRPRIFTVLTVILAISILSVLALVNLANAYAASNNRDNSVKMTKRNGNLNVVGAVDNKGNVPVEVTVGLSTTANNGSSQLINTMIEPTYGTII